MPDICGQDVSRETISRLEAFRDLLIKWNKQINLVAKSTIDDVWARHIEDSAQIMNFVPDNVGKWVDVGSGGGFPGIIAAIMLQELQPNAHVTLIESDQRKCVFLRNASRTLGLNTTVLAERAESAMSIGADVFSARALMPLDGLLDLATYHLKPEGCALVMKGRTVQQEIDSALKNWKFDIVAHPSMTDKEAKILEIRNVHRANA